MRFSLLAALVYASVLLCPTAGSAAPARTASASPAAAATGAPTTSWPQLLRNPIHSSVAGDPKLKASGAATIGVRWMASLRAADLGSPAAVYSAALAKNVVYVGDERGDVIASDEASGANLWSTSVGFGDSERASPMVAPDGSVWVATAYSSTLYKLDGSTGKVLCSVRQAVPFDASPTFVTPPGGVPTVYIVSNHSPLISGPTIAVRESDCKTLWSFTNYLEITGSWSEPAFGVDVTGRGLLFVGTADPDATVYAIDANAGTLVWAFSVANPPNGQYDIGAGATVSPPGKNGFADGAIYQPAKSGHLYGLNLTTGKQIWDFNFNQFNKLVGGGRSSAALTDNTLVLGVVDGVIAVDATHGTQLWHFTDQTKSEVLSSPGIAGPAGDQIVTFGDGGGMFHVLRLSDGAELYHYQTGGYITSSPAIVNGHILIDSSDGFLYDFAMFGGNVAAPVTAVVAPVQGSHLANPNGTLLVSGTARDPVGLSAVQVSVQSGGPAGPWYDAAANTWVNGAFDNVVAVAKPNAQQSAWSFSFPVPAAGASYQVFANAVDAKGQVDRTGAEPTFSVKPSTTEPTIATSALFVAPGDHFTVTGNAFTPGETVAYTLQNHAVGSAVARANGSVPQVTVSIPTSDAFGQTSLIATGKTSGKMTTAPLNITNIWGAQAYGATRTSYEPNDAVFAKTLDATHNGYVARAWLYLTGAAIDASPAIAAGTAYVADDAGQVTAVDPISGAPMWTYTTGSGAPIHASPAVDVNAGLLFFGSDDGDLYTLATATGALVGSAELDGIPTAPAIAGGLLYVGTDAGSVVALNEKTGAPVWSVPLGAAVHSPPAVDSAKSVLVIGDDSGGVTALNAATGAKIWRAATGGAVSAPPAIDGGTVYVGSADGKLYAFSETTGKLGFHYNAHSPIGAGVSLPPNTVLFGTANGTLTELDRSGNLVWSNTSFKNPIVGIGSSTNVPWVETSTGEIAAVKSYAGGATHYIYQTAAGLTTTPAVVDGALYVGAADGGLYAFTPFGFAPHISPTEKAAAAHARLYPPARWKDARSLRAGAISTRSFQPFGPRNFPLHLDRIATAPAGRLVNHGGSVQSAPQSYLIYWAPRGTASAADLATSAASLRPGNALMATAIDTAAYPTRLDDAAVQSEIRRQMVANRWKANVNATVFVVTAAAAGPSRNGFCAYHSALDVDGNLHPQPYAFVPPATVKSGCGSLAGVLARERAEVRSDPLLDAWHDESGNEPLH